MDYSTIRWCKCREEHHVYGTGNDAARTDRHPTLEQERLPRHFHGERQKSVHLHMG